MGRFNIEIAVKQPSARNSQREKPVSSCLSFIRDGSSNVYYNSRKSRNKYYTSNAFVLWLHLCVSFTSVEANVQPVINTLLFALFYSREARAGPTSFRHASEREKLNNFPFPLHCVY